MIISSKTTHILIAVAVFTLVAGTAGVLYALSCIGPPVEQELWQLELSEVTVDGESLSDLDAYEGLTFSLYAQGGQGRKGTDLLFAEALTTPRLIGMPVKLSSP